MKLKTVAARMSGVVCRVEVQLGDAVKERQVLVVLESMKMEIAVQAPLHGTVEAIRVQEGMSVQPGSPLVDLKTDL